VDEIIGKGLVFLQGANDGSFFQPRNDAFTYGRHGGKAQRLAVQATLTTQVSGLKDRDDSFLALFGNHRELHFASLNVKDGIRNIALRINDGMASISAYGSTAVLGNEGPGIEMHHIIVVCILSVRREFEGSWNSRLNFRR
jgi:hypothetical protein